MHLKRRAVAAAATLTLISGIAAALAIPAAAKTLPFGPGQASVITTSATTHITNDPDSGHGTPAAWATNTINRTETLTKGTQVPGTDCGLAASAGCWSFRASLSDSGFFTTIPGAGTPNQACAGCAGETIASPAVSGTIAGNYQVTFDASYPVADASLVGKNHDDHNLPAVAPYTSTTWGEQFFAPGTSFGNIVGGTYNWTYQGPVFSGQEWLDSSGNNDGNSLLAGNITGR